MGLGKLALASLLTSGAAHASTQTGPMTPRMPHYAAKAKRVIQLFMAGAPSHIDLFDPKPVLSKHDGEPIPEEIVKDQRYAFIQRDAALMGSPFKFQQYGESGAELCELMPHLAQVADDMTIIRSMHTSQFNHAPAQIFMNTGSPIFGRPAMGAWATYGLGSESDDLPGFVVLTSGNGSSGGAQNWGCGFMPTAYQGVLFRNQGDPILNVTSPEGIDPVMQRESISLIQELNRQQLSKAGDPEIQTRIDNYELAYRMQSSAPELMDIKSEPEHILDMYGVEPGKPSYASNCLLARRMLERGVRFVSVYHGSWDHHSDVEGGLRGKCRETDQASAALIRDLKQRGLLDDTLVIWGGEFGRTPMIEASAALGRSRGRDHHPQAFSMWMAGGGIKPGQTVGATDDLGFHITEDPIHVHDLQATILHLLGFNHEELTYRFQGRDFRLTDVHGRVMKKLLA